MSAFQVKVKKRGEVEDGRTTSVTTSLGEIRKRYISLLKY